jgi:arylsulfatase A-like enzyme
MVSRLDRDVGRLLDLLEELHLQDNTLVFFTSDNGPHREGGNDPELNDSNGPFRGIKRDLYEGGIRVPMIVRWPGKVPAGRVDATPWWFPDFLPTAATLAGVEPPANLDGRNVLPLLLGQRAPRRSAPFYWEFHEGGFKQAIREGRWKAIRQAPGRTIELYNLDADPSETRDLTPSHPRTARRLARLLDSQRTDSPDWPVNGR